MSPLISVIVPVYKVESFLQECVNSVLNQDYKKIELILVDDGSPDKSGVICDELAGQYSCIKVIHQRNCGAGKARNTGIAVATGEYIMFLDSDDWMEPGMIKKLVATIEEHQADQVRCSCFYASPTKKEKVAFDRLKILTAKKNGELMEKHYGGVLWTVPWNAIYRADIVKKVRFPEGFINEDNYFSPMYVYWCKKIVLLPEALIDTRVWEGSVSSGTSKRPLDRLAMRLQLKEDLAMCGYDSVKVNRRIAKEVYHYIHKTNKYVRAKAMDRQLYEFVLSNLDLIRNLLLRYCVWKKSIVVQ